MNHPSNYCITFQDILEAKKRIEENIVITPLNHFDNLSSLSGCTLYLKLETLQRTKSFKFRGALNKMKTIPANSTVCAVSAGNHSQGVSLASKLCNCKAVIFMPEIASTAKVQATMSYGGEVIQKGANFDESKKAMENELKSHSDWIYVPPFNDPFVIAGQGTIGIEIFESLPEIDVVVVPIGGGGLISGVAFALKKLKPNVRVIGVNVESCPSTYNAFCEYHKKETEKMKKESSTVADGIAVKSPGDLNLQIIFDFVDEVVLVSEDEIALSISLLAERGKIVAEGAGATAFAAVYFKKFKFERNTKIACVISGGNIALKMLNKCIDRALFLRNTRISCDIVIPVGTINYLKLIQIFAKFKVEILSTSSNSHCESVNQNCHSFVLDCENKYALKQFREECYANDFLFTMKEKSLI
jgi:threonine dehydratase